MKIGTKFSITAGLLLVMTAGLGVGSLLAVNSPSRSVDAIVAGPLPDIQRISCVNALLFQFRGDTWRHITSTDLTAKVASEASQNKTKLSRARLLRECEKTISTPRESELDEAFAPLYGRYAGLVDGDVLPLSREGNSVGERRKYLQDAEPNHSALRAVASALVEYNRRTGEADYLSAQRPATIGRTLIIGMLAVGLVGAGILAFVMVRGVNTAQVDAAVTWPDGVVQVGRAAPQLSRGKQSLAEGASEQTVQNGTGMERAPERTAESSNSLVARSRALCASGESASLEETAAALTEINSMAVSNSDKTRAATSLVIESQQKFKETHLKVHHLVAAMVSANASSKKIAQIIKIIDQIAANANILASNAAVEAERAGAAGIGFAVVADEVRALAEQSARAAKDTTALIEESITTFNEGLVSVEIVVKAIHAISEQSLSIRALIDEVNLGSYEQVNAMEQIQVLCRSWHRWPSLPPRMQNGVPQLGKN